MQNPCTSPNKTPTARINRISAHAGHIQRVTPTAMIMQSIATREPTEMSIPPVSMTQVMPQVTQISPALLIRIFRNV